MYSCGCAAVSMNMTSGTSAEGLRSYSQKLQRQHTRSRMQLPCIVTRCCVVENIKSPHAAGNPASPCGCCKLLSSTSHTLTTMTNLIRKGTTSQPLQIIRLLFTFSTSIFFCQGVALVLFGWLVVFFLSCFVLFLFYNLILAGFLQHFVTLEAIPPHKPRNNGLEENYTSPLCMHSPF